MVYTKEKLKEISFPIGGIGTGCFGVSGNGRMIDWEIFNRPDKGSYLPYTHIAVKAELPNGEIIVKVLNGDEARDYQGPHLQMMHEGFGVGIPRGTMAGFAHFESCTFDGEFPVAKLTFEDKGFPGKVIMTVFNPFIPLDSENSSLPAGFFDIEFINNTNEDIKYTAVFSMYNPFEEGINEHSETDKCRMLTVKSGLDCDEAKYGDISVATAKDNSFVQTYWYRGNWQDGIETFWREVNQKDFPNDRVYSEIHHDDCGSVYSKALIESGEAGSVRFVLSWNVPNYENYWTKELKGEKWKNYYATVFENSKKSGEYCLTNFDRLFRKTLEFKAALFGSTLSETELDAVSANLSVLKSPTVLRLEDGSFYGWEGVFEKVGSCEGTCQHVWNYAYALCFLFPDLERSIRENEFKYTTDENGRTDFRTSLPRGRKWITTRSCVDGQMGMVIKTYREWKISGDTEWLKGVWADVKKVLAFAWSDKNPDKWDLDKDGVIDGRQHHTLDLELFGANSYLEGFYLAALKAAAEMAKFLGDEEYKTYEELFEKGYKYTKENLFNGEYFIQRIDVKNKAIIDPYDCDDIYWNDETKEIKYQYGEGCEIDQMVAQWHANICGLGRIFDKEQTDKALLSLYKNNFKESLRGLTNTWRNYSLNDEGGTIMCSFPDGVKKPSIPISYNTETMTGFEYALAGLMIGEGMESEGRRLVKAIRDRYDGAKRNPWNEIECGSNYARAMASYALLPIYSGFTFDLPRHKLGFNPLHKDNFKSIFSIGTGWGTFEMTKSRAEIKINDGYLELEKVEIPIKSTKVLIDGKETEFTYTSGEICFGREIIKQSIVVIK